jgi:hypothetical protein
MAHQDQTLCISARSNAIEGNIGLLNQRIPTCQLRGTLRLF